MCNTASAERGVCYALIFSGNGTVRYELKLKFSKLLNLLFVPCENKLTIFQIQKVFNKN